MILCHSTSGPDWSATVSVGGMTSITPGGLLVRFFVVVCVYVCTSVCYFAALPTEKMLPGRMSFFSLQPYCIYSTHIHIYTHSGI